MELVAYLDESRKPDLLAGLRGDDLYGVDRTLYPRIAHRIRILARVL